MRAIGLWIQVPVAWVGQCRKPGEHGRDDARVGRGKVPLLIRIQVEVEEPDSASLKPTYRHRALGGIVRNVRVGVVRPPAVIAARSSAPRRIRAARKPPVRLDQLPFRRDTHETNARNELYFPGVLKENLHPAIRTGGMIGFGALLLFFGSLFRPDWTHTALLLSGCIAVAGLILDLNKERKEDKEDY